MVDIVELFDWVSGHKLEFGRNKRPTFLGHNGFGRTGFIEFDMDFRFSVKKCYPWHVGVIDLAFDAYDINGILLGYNLGKHFGLSGRQRAMEKRENYIHPHRF